MLSLWPLKSLSKRLSLTFLLKSLVIVSRGLNNLNKILSSHMWTDDSFFCALVSLLLSSATLNLSGEKRRNWEMRQQLESRHISTAFARSIVVTVKILEKKKGTFLKVVKSPFFGRWHGLMGAAHVIFLIKILHRPPKTCLAFSEGWSQNAQACGS